MKFEKTVKHARILNPLKEFAEDTIGFEYRTDPLTGRNTTIINGMRDYVSKFWASDKNLLDSLLEKSRSNCPFCPENVRTRTPMFTPDFFREGRVFVGDTVLIPNLTGHAERSILVVLSKRHHLELNEFTPELIFDGFKAGAIYLKRLRETEPSVNFPMFIFNYLPPAGSSIFHPHMQVLVRDRPAYLTSLLLEKSTEYFQQHSSDYWSDLLVEERGKERYLFETEGVEWLVPFAPLRGMNEVEAIVKGKSNLLELDDMGWFGLSEGISSILQFYYREGYSSFNIIVLSGSMSEHSDSFNVNLKMISRSGIQPSCFTDAWALPYVLWDGEAVEQPETFAARVRLFLEKAGML